MKIICEKCNQAAPPESINIQEGIFHCTGCGEVFKLAPFLQGSDVTYRVEKPSDSRIESYMDPDSMGFIIPSNGLKGAAIFFLFFSVFWNAISWFLFIGSIQQAELFAILFMIPFLLIGAITFLIFLFMYKGVFSVMIDRTDCHAVWSVSGLRYSKRIETSRITDVFEDVVYTQNYKPVHGVGIEYDSKKTLKFGSNLSEDERVWCIGEIKHFLDQHSSN